MSVLMEKSILRIVNKVHIFLQTIFNYIFVKELFYASYFILTSTKSSDLCKASNMNYCQLMLNRAMTKSLSNANRLLHDQFHLLTAMRCSMS